jgi:hypothetical protein
MVRSSVNGTLRWKFLDFLVEDVGKRQNFHFQAFGQLLQPHYAAVLESHGIAMEVHGYTRLQETDALLGLDPIAFL